MHSTTQIFLDLPLFVYISRAVVVKFGPVIGRRTLLLLMFSCGMYIAAPAFLPSSFAMYLGMIAIGAWFQRDYRVSNSRDLRLRVSARYCVGGLYCYVRLTAKSSDRNFSRQLLSWTNPLQFVRL